MDQITLQTLMVHNPWLVNRDAWPSTLKDFLPKQYVNRKTLTPLEFIDNKVQLVIGPRQSGKSTLIRHTLLDSPYPFLTINCEEHSCRQMCRSPALFFSDLKSIAEPIPGLFFEEIQNLPEAGLFLKGVVDLKPNVPIFVTGSVSHHLKSRTRESLAGRAVRHLLLPFSLSELISEHRPTLIFEKEAMRIWNELLIWGGYPEVYLHGNRQILLARLVEAYILRDASDMFQIKRPDAYRKLLSLSAAQISNLINLSDWAQNAGVSVNTVSEYLSLMEESHIIKRIPPFVGGKRAEITSTPKLYFLDNGIRNLLFGGFGPADHRADFGALTENLVFTELSKAVHPLLDTIHFWRSSSGAEVDFVIQSAGRLIAVEVKAGPLHRPKVTRSLRSFIQAYSPDKVVVLNSGLRDEVQVEGCRVEFNTFARLGSDLRGYFEPA